MCGICGKCFLTDELRQVGRASLEGMMTSMHHRGPDEQGVYFFKNVGLGHKRLRIIDLTSGAQPLSNEDNTVWVVYNGEIYNYLQLRQLLLGKGHQFRTGSDTEILVHLYEEFGEGLVSELHGMFSFALWDQKTNFLMLRPRWHQAAVLLQNKRCSSLCIGDQSHSFGSNGDQRD